MNFEEDRVLARLFEDIEVQPSSNVVLPITDFVPPLSFSDVHVIAKMMVDAVPSWSGVKAIVGLADRSAGSIIHVMAQLTGIPYSLANWYPPGEYKNSIFCCEAEGFSGKGVVLFNGLNEFKNVTDGSSKVLFADAVIRSGSHALPLIQGLQKAGVDVAHAVFAANYSDRDGPRTIFEITNVPVVTVGTVVVSEEVHFLVHKKQKKTEQDESSATELEMSSCVEASNFKLLGDTPSKLMHRDQNQNQNESYDDSESSPTASPTTTIRRHVHRTIERTRFKRNLLKGRIIHHQSSNSAEVLSLPGEVAPARPLEFQPHCAIESCFQRVLQMFVNVPVYFAAGSVYPYSDFQLTDFTPMAEASRIEDIADCLTFLSPTLRALAGNHPVPSTNNTNAASAAASSSSKKKKSTSHHKKSQQTQEEEKEVEGEEDHDEILIVSESDRGGGPIAVALSRRCNLRFTMANWTPSVGATGGVASKVQHVGYTASGAAGTFYLNGVKGHRCVVVDDMLSSGGTAEGLLHAIEEAGGKPIECLFASEKTTTKGRERLSKRWPNLACYSVCYFSSSSSNTIATDPTPMGNETPIQTKKSNDNSTTTATTTATDSNKQSGARRERE